jgi:superfamily II DNA/RNA helicase
LLSEYIYTRLFFLLSSDIFLCFNYTAFRQVSKIVKSFANALKFRTSCFTSRSDFNAEHKRLRLGCEFLIATPGRLNELLQRNEIDLQSLQVLILDEADSLLRDETFAMQPIGIACGTSTQFIFASATLPDDIIQLIQHEFPKVKLVSGPGLHRISPNIQEILIDCTGWNPSKSKFSSTVPRQLPSSARILARKEHELRRALQQYPSERTLIFCNTIEQCRNVENILKRDDRQENTYQVLASHSAIDDEVRGTNLEKFAHPLLRKPHILIVTERAARGIDFDRSYVDHVILFDFPHEPSEYLRRVGRTGRAGRHGRVTILAYGRQVDAAKAVIRASTEGKKIQPEDTLPSSSPSSSVPSALSSSSSSSSRASSDRTVTKERKQYDLPNPAKTNSAVRSRSYSTSSESNESLQDISEIKKSMSKFKTNKPTLIKKFLSKNKK